MKRFDGYDQAKENAKYSGGGQLPAGAYVCKVIGVKLEERDKEDCDIITIQYDIAEGDYADFFLNQYQSNQREDKKFKGNKKIYAPNDNTKDQWKKDNFAKWTNAFEESNPGYHWDWDENKWKNKLIGIVFGTTGSRIEGKDITYTEARFPVSADVVRSGNAPEAKFRETNGYGTKEEITSDGFLSVPDLDESELPFK